MNKEPGRKFKLLNLSDTSVAPEAFDALKGIADVDTFPPKRETLLINIERYDGYIATLKTRLDREALDRATRLKVIVTATTGTDHIDMVYAAKKGIAVISLKDDTAFLNSVTATAELAWTLLLSVIRNIPQAFESSKKGIWAREKYRGRQLSGKTLGILGYGRLGRIVAEYGHAFRMKVLACDIQEFKGPAYVKSCDIKTLFSSSDIVSVHVHSTEANKGLVSKSLFKSMKPGAVFINTSRGAVVDEAALLEALESGHLLGAGLDVIDGEWNKDLSNHPLIRYANTHDNVIITPHIGGSTFESERMTIMHTMNKLKAFIKLQNSK